MTDAEGAGRKHAELDDCTGWRATCRRAGGGSVSSRDDDLNTPPMIAALPRPRNLRRTATNCCADDSPLRSMLGFLSVTARNGPRASTGAWRRCSRVDAWWRSARPHAPQDFKESDSIDALAALGVAIKDGKAPTANGDNLGDRAMSKPTRLFRSTALYMRSRSSDRAAIAIVLKLYGCSEAWDWRFQGRMRPFFRRTSPCWRRSFVASIEERPRRLFRRAARGLASAAETRRRRQAPRRAAPRWRRSAPLRSASRRRRHRPPRSALRAP